MCSTEIRPGPCPPRLSQAGNVSTRNPPRDPASRKPSSQDQTWGHKRVRTPRRLRKGGRSRRDVWEGRDGHSSLGGARWEVRDHGWMGHRRSDISLPRHLGRERRKPDTGGEQGPSGRQAQSAGRSLLGELGWRRWVTQRRGLALRKGCNKAWSGQRTLR